MDTCNHLLYHGRDLIVLDVVCQGEVSYYAAEKYVLQGNSTVSV